MDNEQLALVHDHYKETFALIREREKHRDQLFLILVGLVGALFIAVDYPQLIPSALQASTEVDFSHLPVVVVMSSLWTILLTLALRYCQNTVWIEKQYDYLHLLEDKISGHLGEPNVYQREGRVYLTKYPAVSQWAWLLYTLVFPLIVASCVVVLLYLEWSSGLARWTYKSYDTVLGLAVIATFAMYKIPPITGKLKERAASGKGRPARSAEATGSPQKAQIPGQQSTRA